MALKIYQLCGASGKVCAAVTLQQAAGHRNWLASLLLKVQCSNSWYCRQLCKRSAACRFRAAGAPASRASLCEDHGFTDGNTQSANSDSDYLLLPFWQDEGQVAAALQACRLGPNECRIAHGCDADCIVLLQVIVALAEKGDMSALQAYTGQTGGQLNYLQVCGYCHCGCCSTTCQMRVSPWRQAVKARCTSKRGREGRFWQGCALAVSEHASRVGALPCITVTALNHLG
jgi:hypothetical protein